LIVVDSSASVSSASLYYFDTDNYPISYFYSQGISIRDPTTLYSVARGAINSNDNQIGLLVIDLLVSKATVI